MNKSIFLMTAAEESHLLDLSSRIDGALHAEQGETPQDFAKRLMNKEAVTTALQAAGIDTGKEGDFLKKKAAIPSFTVTMLIDNTAPADSRERLFLYTSKAPTTPAEIPQGAAIVEKYNALPKSNREQQSNALAEIRALLASNGNIPITSRYLSFHLWETLFVNNAIMQNISGKELSIELSNLPVMRMPSSPSLYFLSRLINAGPAGPTRSQSNRHEKIEITYNEKSNEVQYTRKNKGDVQTITVLDPKNTLMGSGKALAKLLIYSLSKWYEGGLNRNFNFSLQDVVESGMYSSLDAARRGIKTFMSRQAGIQIAQQVTVKKDGRQQKINVGGFLFYHYEIINNQVTIYANDQMPSALIARFMTFIPTFAFALSTLAFETVYYISYLARQNGKELSERNGEFCIKIDSLRQFLELPAPDAVKNFKYLEKIREPIENAIEEIEEAIRKNSHFSHNAFGFTIEPRYIDDGNIKSWLDGELVIKLNQGYTEQYGRIAEKQERHIREKEKAKERAMKKDEKAKTGK